MFRTLQPNCAILCLYHDPIALTHLPRLSHTRFGLRFKAEFSVTVRNVNNKNSWNCCFIDLIEETHLSVFSAPFAAEIGKVIAKLLVCWLAIGNCKTTSYTWLMNCVCFCWCCSVFGLSLIAIDVVQRWPAWKSAYGWTSTQAGAGGEDSTTVGAGINFEVTISSQSYFLAELSGRCLASERYLTIRLISCDCDGKTNILRHKGAFQTACKSNENFLQSFQPLHLIFLSVYYNSL